MTIIKSLRSGRVIVGATFVAALFVVGEGQSWQPGKAAKAAKAEVKVQEAAVLKNAYILMAMGDHDYDGHRVKAMHHVHEAIKALDHSVLKTRANGEIVVATEEEIATARAAFVAKHQGKLHEGQTHSDLQMREALQLLANVRASVANQKHAKAKENVGEAIKHVEIALKIR